MNEELVTVIQALRADIARMDSKMDEMVKLRTNLEALVEFIPNPIVRKVVKGKLGIRS
jgi:hypothetical protein